jgi:hypothetical protein
MSNEIEIGINNDIRFYHVSVSVWRGHALIKSSRVEVGGTVVSEQVTTRPQWKLVPDHWQRRISGIESKIEGLIRTYRVHKSESRTPSDSDEDNTRFALKGVSLIPRNRVPELQAELNAIRDGDMVTIAAEIIEDWPNIVRWVREKSKSDENPAASLELNQLLARQRAKLPYAFRLQHFPVNIVVEPGSEIAASATEAILSGLQDELNTSIETLVGRVDEGGVIRQSNLNAIKQAFQKYQEFDFLMSPELKQKMQDLSTVINAADFKELNKSLREAGVNSVTAKLAQHLASVRNQCDSIINNTRNRHNSSRTIRV